MQIAVLAIIIMHADELESKSTRESLGSRWVGTESFMVDFKNAKEVVSALLLLAMEEFEDFVDVLRHCENHFTRCVEEYQNFFKESNGGNLPQSATFKVKGFSNLLTREKERMNVSE